jgi:hypothetical protein
MSGLTIGQIKTRDVLIHIVYYILGDGVDKQTSQTLRADFMPYQSDEAFKGLLETKSKVEAAFEVQEPEYAKRRKKELSLDGLTFE